MIYNMRKDFLINYLVAYCSDVEGGEMNGE